METKLVPRLIMYLKASVGRLSLKRRIAFSILITFIIIIPIVVVSLNYFSTLLSGITIITDRDAKLGKIANELMITSLYLKRHERNFIIFSSQSEKENVEEMIMRTDSILTEASHLSTEPEQTILNELSQHLRTYERYFHDFAEDITSISPQQDAQRRDKLLKGIDRFNSIYKTTLSEIKDMLPAERDSVLSESGEYLDSVAISLFTVAQHMGKESKVFENQENLVRAREAFMRKTYELASLSWENMQQHKNDSLHVEAKATRNVITLMIVISIMCFLLVILLPRYIVKPITSLNRAFIKAQEGDLDSEARIISNDEIGDLALNYNRMVERLRTFDEMKTQKIASQKRIIDRILENLEMPICILTKDFIAPYYNASFANLFEPDLPGRVPNGGFEVGEVKGMKWFLDALTEKVTTSATTFLLDIVSPKGTPVKFKGRLVRNPVMELESIILIGVPR